MAFVKSKPELASPDLEFLLPIAPFHAHPWFPLVRPAYRDAFTVRAVLLHPRSRGHVRLRSADPQAPVRLTFNFLTDRSDVELLRQGFRLDIG